MRTTVTLEPDTAQMIRRRMSTLKVSFKQALNDLIREGQTSASASAPYCTPSRSMGRPLINLDKALQLAHELDDREHIRRMESGL